MKLASDGVPQFRALDLQVGAVFLVRDDLERLLRDHREAEAREPRDLLRVVREDPDRGQAEVGQDLRADPVFTRVAGSRSSRLASTVSRPFSCSS